MQLQVVFRVVLDYYDSERKFRLMSRNLAQYISLLGGNRTSVCDLKDQL